MTVSIDGTNGITYPVGTGVMQVGPTLMTAQATTSGTAINFTGIPAGVKRITVMLNGVSTNGTSYVRLQIGPSGGVETSNYLGTSTTATAVVGSLNFTSGFDIYDGSSAAHIRHGSIMFTLLNQSTNTWVIQGVIGFSDTARTAYLGGSKSLSGTLDRVRLTTVNGTDTFDAGSVNILYE